MGRGPPGPVSLICPDDARLPGAGCRVNDGGKHFMRVRWWRRGGGAGWGRNTLVPFFVVCLVVCLAGIAAAVRHGVDNVHRPDANCLECHTVDRTTLETEQAAARAKLAPDLESRCFVCHDEGPSHHTGIKPTR